MNNTKTKTREANKSSVRHKFCLMEVTANSDETKEREKIYWQHTRKTERKIAACKEELARLQLLLETQKKQAEKKFEKWIASGKPGHGGTSYVRPIPIDFYLGYARTIYRDTTYLGKPKF